MAKSTMKNGWVPHHRWQCVESPRPSCISLGQSLLDLLRTFCGAFNDSRFSTCLGIWTEPTLLVQRSCPHSPTLDGVAIPARWALPRRCGLSHIMSHMTSGSTWRFSLDAFWKSPSQPSRALTASHVDAPKCIFIHRVIIEDLIRGTRYSQA